MIPEAHLARKNPVKRSMESARAYPLTEENMPTHDGSSQSIINIVDWLDVEKSARYQPANRKTYCNIYAHDFCGRMGAYFPRVWWTDSALENKTFSPKYGSTVREMTVNMLYEWFPKFGPGFGWQKLERFTDAQKFANEGRCVVMLAANRDRKRSGHVTVVVPETIDLKSEGARGITIWPVQSQAGIKNKQYFVANWWKKHEKIQIWVK